jgi:hypothetical protein
MKNLESLHSTKFRTLEPTMLKRVHGGQLAECTGGGSQLVNHSVRQGYTAGDVYYHQPQIRLQYTSWTSDSVSDGVTSYSGTSTAWGNWTNVPSDFYMEWA